MSEPLNMELSSNPKGGNQLDIAGQLSKEGIRRSKKDSKRDYHCGCGKSYLSNPALYTHVKTKHDGKLPDGSYNTVGGSFSKRGRPRRAILVGSVGQISGIEGRVDDIQANNIEQEFDIQNDNKQSRLIIIDQRLVLERDLKVFECVEDGRGNCEEFQSCFPAFKNCNNLKIEQHPFCVIMKRLHSKQSREEISIDSSIEIVMSVYLWCLTRYFNPSLYKLTTILFRAFRECLNDFGYNLIEKFQKSESLSSISIQLKNTDLQQEGQKILKPFNFTLIETSETVPLIASFFLMKFLPKYAQSFDQNLALYLMIDFCNWLNRKGLSAIQINIHSSLGLQNENDDQKLKNRDNK